VTDYAALIRGMAAAGAPAEAIALAVEAIQVSEVAINSRRAADRDRKRGQRSKLPENVTGQSAEGPHNVTPISANVPAETAPVSPHEEISSPPSATPSPKGDSPLAPRRRRSPPRSADFEVPDWIPADAWAAFAEMRSRKGKPLDSYTAKHLFGRLRTILDAGWNIEDVINKAAVGNHDGFWMPDGRDSNLRRTTANGKPRALNMEELRSAIRYAEDQDDFDRLAELREALAALRAPPADPQVAKMVHAVSEKLQGPGDEMARKFSFRGASDGVW
jgi:hypothetical protein